MFFLPKKTSRARLREAENARRNRWEILKALADGQVTRRELIKWGIFTGFGALAWKHGLNPFVGSAWADSIPTGLPTSPLFGVQAFTQPMPRFDVLARNPNPFTFHQSLADGAIQPDAAAPECRRWKGWHPAYTGPIEGRPPGPIWAHQGFDVFPPKIAVEATQEGAKANTVYNPQVASNFNSGINPATPIPLAFHRACQFRGPTRCGPSTGPFPRSWSSAVTPSRSCSATTTSFRSTSDRTAASGGIPSARTSTTATTGGERRLHRGSLLPRPVLRLSLAHRSPRDSGPSIPGPPIPGLRRR